LRDYIEPPFCLDGKMIIFGFFPCWHNKRRNVTEISYITPVGEFFCISTKSVPHKSLYLMY
jgi:hypothetical protein